MLRGVTLLRRLLGKRQQDDGVQLKTEPYPYYVKQPLVPEAEFRELCEQWPTADQFKENIGYNRKSLRLQYEAPWGDFTDSQRAFWRRFIGVSVKGIIAESLQVFAPFLANKYASSCQEVVLQNCEIVELFGPQLPIDVHAHHFHSPLLLGTCVFYVDDAGHDIRGTTIWRAVPGHDSVAEQADLESRHRTLDQSGRVERCDTIKFKPNAAFIMHDCPIGWHRVEDASGQGHIGPRRHMLFNWGLPFDHCVARYGVDLETYMRIREEEQGSPRTRDWIARDIEDLRRPCSYSSRQLDDITGAIKIRGHAAMDFF